MAASATPLYPSLQNVQGVFPCVPMNRVGVAMTTANTAKDGTGTQITLITAGTAGAYVKKIRFHSCGTNVASVARLFLNNGSDNATAANNTLIADVSLPATANSEVAQILTTEVEISLEMGLQPGFKINATIGTTVAAGWTMSIWAGDYLVQ